MELYRQEPKHKKALRVSCLPLFCSDIRKFGNSPWVIKSHFLRYHSQHPLGKTSILHLSTIQTSITFHKTIPTQTHDANNIDP